MSTEDDVSITGVEPEALRDVLRLLDALTGRLAVGHRYADHEMIRAEFLRRAEAICARRGPEATRRAFALVERVVRALVNDPAEERY